LAIWSEANVNREFSTFLKLTGPVFAAIFVGVAAMLVHRGANGVTLQVPILYLLQVTIPLTPAAIQYLLAGVAVVCLLIPAVRDYSSFFPKHLHLKVSFDDPGLHENLNSFKPHLEKTNFAILTDWEEQKRQYFCKVNSRLADLGCPFQFQSGRFEMGSSGTVEFQVEREKGLQNYRLTHASGFLMHRQLGAKGEELVLPSTFELNNPDGYSFRATLADVYYRWAVMIEPKFMQKYIDQSLKDFEILLALTRVRFIPSILIGPTIYLADFEGSLIPIAYGEYRWVD
jgi:hypothetical protein